MVKLVAESRVTWVQFLMSAETLCSASAILRGTEPVSALTRAFYFVALSIIFFFLDFVSGELALTEL